MVRRKKYIKIPWIQQHYPNWERSYDLFVAWAIHKGSYTDPPNYKKLKGNFRCAMRKSNDFMEIASVEGLQKGNYKLYELLDKESVREMKRKRKKDRDTQDKKLKKEQPSPPHDPWDPLTPTVNLLPDIDGLTSLDIVPPDMFTSARCSPHSSGSDGNSDNPIFDSCEEFKIKFVEEVDDFIIQSKNFSPNYSPCSGISDETGVGGGVEQYFADPFPGGNNMMPSPPITAVASTSNPGGFMKVSSPFSYSVQPMSSKLARISKMMQNYRFSPDMLPQFNMRLYYDDQLMLNFSLDLTLKPNFSGCRLFFGDINEHRKIFEMPQQEALVEFPPAPPGTNKTISKILDTFQQGMTVEYDPREAVLRCRRHCRSAVFFIGSESAIELKRRESMTLFDYHHGLSRFMAQQKTSHMQSELVIGTKPHRNKLIKLKFRPLLATTMVPLSYNGSITSNTELLSCCMDQPDSLDRQLEKLKL